MSYIYETGVKALDNVSLEINRGELVVLMGENGSGKTTLLKHLNGLLKPTTGRVYVDGLDTRDATIAELAAKVGLVFQNADEMFFEPTVEDEVAFALRNFGYPEDVIKKRVSWVLEFLELTAYRDVSPFMLSGGEKKRLALAVILAWNPEVIALDEPTIGQDSLQKEKLAHIVKLLKTQGRTVIMASHDVEFIADLKPRVVLLKEGRVVKDGAAEDVLTDVELLASCSITPPQIVTTLNKLRDLGINHRRLSVEEAAYEILKRIGI